MKPTLVVLAAGIGSRYGGVKQIDGVGLGNETLLDFATWDARKSGYGKAVYIIRRDIEKDFRERIFDRVARNFDAQYVFQAPDALMSPAQKRDAAALGRKKPWGTLHAVLCAGDVLKTPFTVINADDYYGRSAFETLAGHLSGIAADSREHAMVGYILGNTLSKSGTVTRGVCTARDGYLVSMEEQMNIRRKDGRIVSLAGDKQVFFIGTELVSMNFFGFSLGALDHFAAFWEDFIAKNAASEKAECLLPTAASTLVEEGNGRIKMYTSLESWFGMTYPDDRDTVKKEIAKKVESGYYPRQLWER
ncbi:MAG: hypothetical protein LBS64_03130 [Spirochaetaceae bacterium]|jgi:choline kinase|nr:hypothetical protein [Spirochaetaceae bacterium]